MNEGGRVRTLPPIAVPEGPYEIVGPEPEGRARDRPGLSFADALGGLLRAAETDLRLRGGHRDLATALHLIRDHLSGRLTTRASLCAVSRT